MKILPQQTNAQNADMNGNRYKVPLMTEIKAIEWNGYNVVSTFSGGGGSCLGYRMAGYRVLWANEFVEEAQKTYKANHPNSILNTKDIREVTGNEILKAINLKKGEIDIFDGSPPCCSFSTAGSREKGWGKKRAYSDNKAQRTDDLFFEYARLLSELKPKVFIAENVSGLIKGSAKGYFKLILARLKDCGYEVKARLINAKYLGVPQSRERIIFMGVRNDIAKKYDVHPTYPKPQGKIVTLSDAIGDIKNSPEEEKELEEMAKKYAWGGVLKKIPKNQKKAIHGSAVMDGSYFNLSRESLYKPCSTICQMNGTESASGNCHPLYDRKFTIAELKRITSIPDDFILTGTYKQQWERLGRMVPPLMMREIASTVRYEILDRIGETNGQKG